MMAQTQPAQGCAVCGGPSDLAPDPRETAQRSDWRGRRPLVTLGLSKVTRPSPKGGRNPIEDGILASHAAQPHTVFHCVAKPRHHIQSANVRIRFAIRIYGLRGEAAPLHQRRERLITLR